MPESPIRRRELLKTVAGTSVALAVGTGTANASPNTDEPRIEFNSQTRRLTGEEPSVHVAHADLPERGFVMVHETHDMAGMSESGCPDKHEVYGETEILDPGHYEEVEVPLTTVPEEPGTVKLVAMIHTVDGDGEKVCPPEVREKADVEFVEFEEDDEDEEEYEEEDDEEEDEDEDEEEYEEEDDEEEDEEEYEEEDDEEEDEDEDEEEDDE